MVPDTTDNLYQPRPRVAPGIKEPNYRNGYFQGYHDGYVDYKRMVEKDLKRQADKFEKLDPGLSEVIHIVINNL